jgi:DNA-binding NtrC family response regulator
MPPTSTAGATTQVESQPLPPRIAIGMNGTLREHPLERSLVERSLSERAIALGRRIPLYATGRLGTVLRGISSSTRAPPSPSYVVHSRRTSFTGGIDVETRASLQRSSIERVEDILDAALEQREARVLTYVLDALRREIDADAAWLVIPGATRAEGVGVDGGSLRRFRSDFSSDLLLRVEISLRPTVEVSPGHESWSLAVPLSTDRPGFGIFWIEGRGSRARADAWAQTRANDARILLRAAVPIDRLARENRRLGHEKRGAAAAMSRPLFSAPSSDLGSVYPAVRADDPPEQQLAALFPEIAARSRVFEEILATVARLARTELPILIEGESGTGKELIARAIHRLGTREDGPFVSENCGAIPDSLIESELFGFERGAFTGAHRDHAGLIERAHGGTLFLDEIGEMKLELQKRLLRVLQEREVRRVGGGLSQSVDFRLVSATNRDLEQLVRSGHFRSDLFYRLQATIVRVPALRDRQDDIPALVDLFVRRYASRDGVATISISESAMDALIRYSWPGNVRELENEIWRLASTLRGDVRVEDLSPRLRPRAPRRPPREWKPRSWKEIEDEFLRPALQQTIAAVENNLTEAARILGLPRTTLYRRLERFDLVREDFSSALPQFDRTTGPGSAEPDTSTPGGTAPGGMEPRGTPPLDLDDALGAMAKDRDDSSAGRGSHEIEADRGGRISMTPTLRDSSWHQSLSFESS